MTLTNDQQELRKSGIGASEIATIAGINPYQTPLDLWLVKTGREEAFSGNEYTELGHHFEAIIADWFEKRHAVRLHNPKETLVHPKHPWLLATPDRIIVGDERENLEIKTVWSERQAAQWGEPGTDEVPESYILQVHHQMAILEALGLVDIKDRSRLAAFIAPYVGSDDTAKRDYVIPINKTLQSRLIEMAREFWRNVETATPPPLAEGEDPIKLYPQASTANFVSDEEAAEMVRQFEAVKAEIKAKEAAQRDLRTRITERISSASGIMGEWGKATWKNNKSSEKFDLKQALKDGAIPQAVIEKYTSIVPGPRVLRIKLAKED